MKLHTSTFLQDLNTVMSATHNKIIPICETIKLDSQKAGILNLTSTDLEQTISVDTSFEGDEITTVCIPATILYETVKNISDEYFELTVNDKFSVTIKTTSGKYKISGIDPKEFPTNTAVHFPQTIEVDFETFKKSIEKVINYTSADELRPSMTGVCFDFSKTFTDICTTDAHRLALIFFENSENLEFEKQSLVIPKNVLKSVIKLNASGKIKIYLSKSHVMFTFGGAESSFETSFFSRLIDARYPDYKAVVPQPHQYITLSTKAVSSALKRLFLYSNKSTSAILFSFQNDILTLQSSDIDFGLAGLEEIHVGKAPNIKIGLNGKYALQMLNQIDSEYFRLGYSGENRAVTFEPETGNYKYILMPIVIEP